MSLVKLFKPNRPARSVREGDIATLAQDPSARLDIV